LSKKHFWATWHIKNASAKKMLKKFFNPVCRSAAAGQFLQANVRALNAPTFCPLVRSFQTNNITRGTQTSVTDLF